MKKQQNINFIIPIWGNTFIENALNFSLISLITKKNLQVIKKKNSKLIFCSKKKNISLIKNHKNYSLLKQFFKIYFVKIDDIIIREKKRRLLTHIYLKGIRKFNDTKNIYALICADDYFADGSLKILEKYKQLSNFCIFENQLFVNDKIKQNNKFLDFYKKPISCISAFNLSKKYFHNYTNNSILNKNHISNLNPFFFLLKYKKNIFVKYQFVSHPRFLKPFKKIKFAKCFLDYGFAIDYVKIKNFFYANDINKYYSFSIVEEMNNEYKVLKNKHTIENYIKFLKKVITKEHLFHFKNFTVLSPKKFKKEDINKKHKKITNYMIKKIEPEINNYKKHPFWGQRKKLSRLKEIYYNYKILLTKKI